MKTLLTIILASLLAVEPVLAQTNNVPDPPIKPDGGVLICALVLGCVLVGGAYVIYIYTKKDQCKAKHTIVLLKDSYDENWQEIARVTLLVTTNKTEIFREVPREAGNRYRVQDLGIVP